MSAEPLDDVAVVERTPRACSVSARVTPAMAARSLEPGAWETIAATRLKIDDGATWMPSMMAPEAQQQLRALRPLAPRGTAA